MACNKQKSIQGRFMVGLMDNLGCGKKQFQEPTQRTKHTGSTANNTAFACVLFYGNSSVIRGRSLLQTTSLLRFCFKVINSLLYAMFCVPRVSDMESGEDVRSSLRLLHLQNSSVITRWWNLPWAPRRKTSQHVTAHRQQLQTERGSRIGWLHSCHFAEQCHRK